MSETREKPRASIIISTRVPPSLHQKLEHAAAERGISMGELLRLIVVQWRYRGGGGEPSP
jgi:hypothetical protein